MHHATVMGGRESGTDLTRDESRSVHGQPAFGSEHGGQILALDPFHGQKVPAFRLPDVENSADVRVRHLARDPRLVV